jgi:flagellar basal-body rod protein FlgG
MMAQQQVQDALAGNLANLNTNGFKQDVAIFKELHGIALDRVRHGQSEGSIGTLGLGAAFDSTQTDYSAGAIRQTNNPTDLALNGEGFFSVQTPQGERYTRDGQLSRQPSGKSAFLVDGSGNRVLGLNGPIDVGSAQEITIDETGVVFADKKRVDQLKLVTAPKANLKKEGENLYRIDGTPVAAKPTVRQGALEDSNVNAVTAMVQMITVQRAYDSAQRAVSAQDEILGRAVNDVGRT